MSAAEATSWKDLFDMAHAAVLVAGGIGYLWLWRRHRFWLPRYAHVLALGGTAVVALAVLAGGPSELARRERELWIVLLLPLLIYFVFVFYGGAEEARKRHERSKRDGGAQ